ncbi:MAG: winged helix-turn-helix transcriptional regulator [Turicibacter sp.]|uniref:Transcriptional regulator n=1 Tax=Turicibacter faecis TaxID=2963365 RepID=A0ABM8IMH2_9FIRM|nr:MULTISPECIES: metalloregulator ArsR/SmtB family transcription factor [unclassified Turicibacter]MCI9351364.1 winged helix-turn-helix transcriptional regulator [Turicibacter sp.]MCU7204342.1 metalloregulator ArsR/SmtB family transcription factor [Turicibacter sp. TA25]MCU7208259.1 metalloregulator ArsR/SmtB family transcription factor [Turicibacter sp. 1E2]BEH90994.1 transcriptional regulator [Turicibacter sp. TC023]
MKEEEAAQCFKALSDTNRLKIIGLLVQRERCACELLEFFQISQPTLSHHMKILVSCGLVQSRKVGTWNYYRMNEAGKKELLRQLSQLLSITEEGKES